MLARPSSSPPPNSLFVTNLAWSRDKLKTCLCYFNASGHQTWQGGDITWRASTQNVAWSLNHMVLWDHVTYYILYIFTWTCPMATKHGNLVIHCQGPPSINSYSTLNVCSLACGNVREQNHYISTITKHIMVVRSSPATDIHDLSMMWLWEVTWQIISPSKRPKNIKLDKVLTYNERLPSSKLS